MTTASKGRCEDCAAAKENPHWARFCPSCLWCGARLIQRIQALVHRPAQERTQRCKAVLTDWVAMGHAEHALRSLAKGPTPLQPADFSEPEQPKKTKRR